MATTNTQGGVAAAIPFKMSGVAYVWMAVMIFAASNSIVKLLVAHGALSPVEGRNAITFCNVLAVGNAVAMVTLLAVFRGDWTRENLRKLTRGDWIVMTVSAALASALSPSLFFFAIENTSVTNVVLVGRIEPPLIIFLSVILFKEALDRWALAGAMVALVGAISFLVFSDNEGGFMFGKGEFYALGAAGAFVLSTLLSKRWLGEIPLGIFAVYRTGLGVVFVTTVALYLYGPQHFEDAFEPIVLKWMLIYGSIIVVGGTLFWNLGLKTANSGEVSLAASFSPIAGILFAMLLLGEEPGMGLYVGGPIIVLGIAIGQFGRRGLEYVKGLSRDKAMELECECNFRGV